VRIRIVGALTFAGVLLVGFVRSVAASNPSCTAQFASSTARATTSFGQNVVAKATLARLSSARDHVDRLTTSKAR